MEQVSGGLLPNLPFRAFLTVGDIAPEIVRVAAEQRADGIVLVRRSHMEPGRAAVLRSVLETAPCPVLLVGAAETNEASDDE